MTHSDEAERVRADEVRAEQGELAAAMPEPVPGGRELTSATPRTPAPREVGGREGPEPTRFGDWELRGRCIDF
jgi:hypothetical protein